MSQRRQYPFQLIEPKWRDFWARQQTFRAFNPGEEIPPEHPFALRHGLGGVRATAANLPAKFYILDMFPYPSGSGLHVGHPEGYTATDILARYRRAQGRHVLHPMGWDAFGLPAEQYAIKHGQHPRITTNANIANFKRQIQSLGFSYDWNREVDTTDPKYFRWTQWIFLQLYGAWFNPATQRAEHLDSLVPPAEVNTEDARRAYRDAKRLAYVCDAPVNWCPDLGTVLANEEVIDGKSEVGGFPVIRRPMRQWMLRITAYAERLLQDLETIDWSESLKGMQRNWIGRSEGAEVQFTIIAADTGEVSPDQPIASSTPSANVLTVFTTRPDTLFGATYMVLAPEHKLVDQITVPAQREAVEAYKSQVTRKSDLERTDLAKTKSGVFTGAYARNPVNEQPIPIWIADYVLATYGTGAIMAVPAHDTRDFEFATQFELPIVQVVRPPDPKTDWQGFTEEGTAVNSTGPRISLEGLPTADAKRTIITWLETEGLGKRSIHYKLRDWLFSRQRYWGEPFPIVWKKSDHGLAHEALAESALPLVPPTLDDYKPTADGQPPLARAREWVLLSDGSLRETNTMPQWAGSCWYYLRYLDTANDQEFLGTETERYWMGASAHAASGGLANSPIPTGSAKEAASSAPGVDLYVGGTEHAVLHLLYARFWHKVLFDLGFVSTPEPFFKLVNQGLILGEMEFTAFAFQDGKPCSLTELRNLEEEATPDGPKMVGHHKVTGAKVYGFKVAEDEVENRGEGVVLKNNPGIRVDARSFKMSKSRGNVVNPDTILHEFGADSLRLYEMFMGPLQDSKPWSTRGVEGVYRFLGRVWRLFVSEESEIEFNQRLTTTEPDQQETLLEAIRLHPAISDGPPTSAQLKALHGCIKKVTEALDGMRFNTAISAMMEFVNAALSWEKKPAAMLRTFLQLLAPFAPHLAEELWVRLHGQMQWPVTSLSYEAWPHFDPAVLVEDTLEIPVQVNGKLRDVIRVPAACTDEDLERAAIAAEKVQPFLAGKQIRKIIVVPRKLVNIAVS